MQASIHQAEVKRVNPSEQAGHIWITDQSHGGVDVFLDPEDDSKMAKLSSIEDFGQQIVDMAREQMKEVEDE